MLGRAGLDSLCRGDACAAARGRASVDPGAMGVVLADADPVVGLALRTSGLGRPVRRPGRPARLLERRARLSRRALRAALLSRDRGAIGRVVGCDERALLRGSPMGLNPWLCMALLWIGAAGLMGAGWLWQRRHLNAGIVDVLWSLGIGGGAVLYAVSLGGAPLPRTLLGILAGVWSSRLALHLAQRVLREPEDGRYRRLRERWGGHQGKLFAMFQFQALLIVGFSIPFLAVAC